MIRNRALHTVLVAFVLLSSATLFAQANGSLSGTVVDKTGSVVPNAKITVSSQGTGVVRDTTTDSSGHYLVPLLPVAFYTIRAESQGFQATEQKDIRLQVNEQRELDFTLNPASVSTTVEVTANEVAVETTNPSLGQVITSEQVAELPLNGRDFVQLATLTPGVTQETNPGSFFNGGPSSEVSARGTFSLSVGGSRAQATDWLLDDNDNNELTAGGISILPSIDAIQEFKVLTYNYSAQYGTRAGPTVLVTTKAGTNSLHGTVFEFFRNTKLDSRSYFASSKEQFNLNQFGGAAGGAIQKDKTFFFVDYEAKRQRHGIPFTGLVPTQDMILNGDFSKDPFGDPNSALLFNPYTFTPFQCDASGNPVPAAADGSQAATGNNCRKIPANMINTVGQNLLKLYPVSNASNSDIGYNYTNVPVRSLNEGKFDVRLDHNLSPKDSVFARFSYDQAVSFVPGGSPGFASQSAFASTQNITNHARNVALTETHQFSDHTFNQFNAGFNRIFNHIKSFGDRTCAAAKIGILGANLDSSCPGAPAGLSQSKKECISCGLTSILMGNYWALGDRGFAPFQGGTNVFSFSDALDLIRGKHDIHVGMGFRAQQMNVTTNGFQDGFNINFVFTGDAAADLILGQLGGAIHDQTFNGATTGRRWKMFRPYVQDDWRITNNLTVNLGVAWALVTPITEARNRQANFNFTTGQYLVAGSSPALAGCAICIHTDGRVGVQFDKTAIEPRIGVSWKPFGNPNTAVRFGYSIFHDSSWNQGAQGLWQNPPYYAESDRFQGPCPFNNAASATPQNCGVERNFLDIITAPPNPASFPGAIQAQNLNFKQGLVQQFNINVEHQLPGNVILTAGYAGSRSTHILVDGLNLNVSSPTACYQTVIDPNSGNPILNFGYDPNYHLGCRAGIAATDVPTPPQPNFGVVADNYDSGRARYDSVQIKAETKSSKNGIYALIGYTYSRTHDSGFADGLGTFPGATYWPLPGTSKADWALSQINLNHQLTASVTYDLPFGKGKKFGSNWSAPVNTAFGGWEVDVIERAISGFPLFVVNSNGSGVNFQWNGNSLNRPDQVGDPNKAGPVAANPGCTAPTQIHTLAHWFNQCAFVSAADGKLGTANRAPVDGPRFINTDLSLIKHFSIREGIQLDFRSEFFNLFNHAQFYLPGDGTGMQNFASGTSFGKVSNTVNNARLIQFALKLKF